MSRKGSGAQRGREPESGAGGQGGAGTPEEFTFVPDSPVDDEGSVIAEAELAEEGAARGGAAVQDDGLHDVEDADDELAEDEEDEELDEGEEAVDEQEEAA